MEKQKLSFDDLVGVQFYLEHCGGLKGKIIGTAEHPRLEVDEVGLNERGSFGRYIDAGRTYTLHLTTDFNDMMVFVVDEDECRPGGGSQVVISGTLWDDGHLMMDGELDM